MSAFVLLVPLSEGALNQCQTDYHIWLVLAMTKPNFRVLSTWYQQVFPVFVYFDLLEVFLRQTRFAGFGFRMKTNASLDHKPSMCFLVLLSLFFNHML